MALFKKSKKEEETGQASSSRIADAVRNIFSATVEGQRKAVEADQAVAKAQQQKLTTAAQDIFNATVAGQQAATQADMGVQQAQRQRRAQPQAQTQHAQDASQGPHSAYVRQQESLADIQRRQNQSQAETMAGLYAGVARELADANALYRKQLAGTDTGDRANELMTQPVLERAGKRQSSLESGDPKQGAGKYLKYLTASDFAEKSQAREDNRDETYRYINNIGDERARQQGYAMQRGADSGLEKYQLMTDAERGVYNYLYSTQGKTAANGFLARLEPELNEQWYAGRSAWQTEQANQDDASRALWSAATVAQEPVRSLSSAAALAEDAIRTATGQGIDPNSELRRASALTQDIRQSIAEHYNEQYPNGILGFTGGDIYNTIMSAADSAMNAAFSYAGGQMLSALRGVNDINAIMDFTNKLGSALMSSEVAASSVAESKGKGYSDLGAMSLGLVRGYIEYMSEKLGGDWAISWMKKNPLNPAKVILQTMIPEGVEELMSDFGNETVNLLLDNLLGTDESYIKQAYDYFKENGSDNPWRDTLKTIWAQESKSFVSGALAAFGTGTSIYAQNRGIINETATRLNTDGEGVVKVMEDMDTDNPSAVYRLAQLTGADSVKALKERYEQVAGAFGAKSLDELNDMIEQAAEDGENIDERMRAAGEQSGQETAGGSLQEQSWQEKVEAAMARMEAEQGDTNYDEEAAFIDASGNPILWDMRDQNHDALLAGDWSDRKGLAAAIESGYIRIKQGEGIELAIDNGVLSPQQAQAIRKLVDGFTGNTFRVDLDVQAGNHAQTIGALSFEGADIDGRKIVDAINREIRKNAQQSESSRTPGVSEGGTYGEAPNVQIEKGPSALTGDKRTAAYILASRIKDIEDMASVKQLTGNELNDRSKPLSQQIQEFFDSVGGQVNRDGLGPVHLGDYGIGGVLNHRPINRAKVVTLAAVPEVIRDGRIINYDPNWKGRGYPSLTIAAPVDIGGRTVYVAAVIDQRDGYKFYLNECVDSDGNYIRITEDPSDSTKSGVTVQDGVTRGSEGSSDSSIHYSEGNGNSENSVRESNEGYGNSGRVERSAAEHFGTTDDFRTAGYMLTDGTMLDFSGAHWLEGYDDDYIADWRRKNDIRQVDHEDIFEAYEALGDEFPNDSALDFMRRGNIRMVPEGPGLEIATAKEPSAAQYRRIKEYVREMADGGGFTIDFTRDRRNRAGTLRYNGNVSADRVVNDIKHFFRTGEVRQPSTVLQFRETEKDLRERNPEYANDEGSLRLAAEAVDGLQYSLFDDDYVSGWTGERDTVQTAEEAGQQVRTLGKGIRAELVQNGYVEFRGKTVNSPEELAQLAQCLRDPRFETFRVILMKGNEIVSMRSISSKLPGYAVVSDKGMAREAWSIRDRMRRTGADGYYLMHNHPSGNVEASDTDLFTTGVFINELGRDGYRGHVILDHTEFGLIEDIPEYDPRTESTRPTASIHEIPGVSGQDPLRSEWQDITAIGGNIMSADDIAFYGRMVQTSDDVTVIMYRSASGEITGVQEVLNKTFLNNSQLRGYLKNQLVEFGSTGAAIYTTNRGVFDMTGTLTREGYAVDAVYADPSLREDFYESIRADYGVEPVEDYFAGKKVSEYRRSLNEPQAPYGAESRPTLENNPQAAMGKDGRAYTNNEAIDFTYAIVPLDSLLTSHDRYGNVNAEYPSELQPRDRSRATSQADIDAMAKSLNPDLLADSKTAQNGAPIVTDTGVVISGNGRTAAIQTAYEYGTAEEYVDYLREHAEEFGINPDSIPENPVLVRIAKDSSDAARLARDLNVTTTAAMSATETAMVDAEKLQELMTRISPDDSDLTSAGNRGFVQAFVDEIVPESERGSMYDDSGNLSKTGLSRIQNAIFATAYGNEERLARLAEYTDDTAKNITKALVKASNGALQLQSDVKNGAAYNVDVTGTIMKALDLYEESRSSGQSFEDFMTQYRMDDTDEVAWDIAQFIAAHKRSSKAISDYFSAMYSAALDRDPNQMSLLGGDENGPTVEEILRDAERYFLEQDEKNELGYEPGGESKARRAYEEDQRRWREDRERTLAERSAGVNEEAERTDNEIAGEMTEESELRKVYEEYKRINAEARQREAEENRTVTSGVNAADLFGPTTDERETKATERAVKEGSAALEEFAERMPDDPMDLIAEQTPVTAKRAGEERISTKKGAGDKTLKEKVSDAWHRFVRSMANDGDAIHTAGRRTGNKALDGMFFYAKAATLRAQQWIQGKRMSFNLQDSGDGLNAVFDPIRAKGDAYYRDFQLYMYHMLNVERMSRSNGTDIAVAKETLAQLAAANPQLAAMSDDELQRRARQYREGGGLGFAENEELGEMIAEYWATKQELYRAERQQNKPVFGFDASAPDADDSRKIARDLIAQHPEFEEEAQKVYDYIDALLQYRVDAGLITQADMDNLKSIYPHYVPVMYDFGDAPAKVRKGGLTVSSTIKGAKGGNTTLLPLHYALARQTLAVMRNAGYQQLGAEVLKEYENNESLMGKWVLNTEESDAAWEPGMADNDDVQKPHENVVTVFRNGKRYDMTLSEDMAYAFNSLQGSRQGWADLGFMVKGNDMFKKLCTAYNPLFMITNPVRDVQDALLYSTDMKRWMKNYPKAIAQISGSGKYWQMYKAMGAVNNSYFDWATGENANKKGGKPGKVEALNMAIEQAPRLAEYMTVLENAERDHGEITQNDLMEAFNAAAEITTNFSRGGTVGRWVNRNLVPFWNPGVQGLSKAVRTVTETKSFKSWALLAMKAAALGMIPAFLNGLLYRDDDEWDVIDDQMKTDYYLFKTTDGIWIKIPKGRMLAALSAPVVGAQEALRGDEVDWGELGSAAFGSIAPNNPLESNLFATAMRADLFNPDSPGKTWYGGDIESKRLQGYAPGERYDESTDLISKWLGGKIGVSPKKISYVIDQYSGVLGDLVLPYLTPKAERGVYIGDVAIPLSNAFMSRFTTDTVSSNTIGDEYYGLLDQLGYQAKAGDTAAAQAERYMNRAGSAVSDYYAQIRKIENDENLTDKEKSALVRELRKQLNLTEQQITADAQAYLEAAQQYIQDHPQFDYTDDAAVDAFTEGYNSIQTAEKYYIDADSAAKKMKDEVYLAINREHFGAEYALLAYSKDTYKKAQALNEQSGLSYEDYFDYYFGSRYIYADKDADGKSISGSKKEKMVEYINGLDITDEQKDALFLANNYKDLKTTPWHGGSGKYTKGSGKRRGGRRGGGGGRKSNSAPKSTRANNIGRLSTGYSSGIDLSQLFPSVASTRKSGAENLSTDLARIVNRGVDVSDLFKRTSRKKTTPKGRTTVDFRL